MFRHIAWILPVLTLAYAPVVVRGDLIVTQDAMSVLAYDLTHGTKANDHGFGVPATLPDSGSISAVGGSFSTVSYSFTQSGDTVTFEWDTTQFQDGSFGAYASTNANFKFTTTSDVHYTFTTDWNGSGTPGSPFFETYIYEVTPPPGSYVFDDTLLTKHSGVLEAGHTYQFVNSSSINEGGLRGGETRASGHFSLILTTSTVPEPSAMLLAMMGLVGTTIRWNKTWRVQRQHCL